MDSSVMGPEGQMRRFQRFFFVPVGAEQPATGWSPGSMRPAHSSPRMSFSGTAVKFRRMVVEDSPGNKPGSLQAGLRGSWEAGEWARHRVYRNIDKYILEFH
jgi:hypothetical protein